MSRLTLLLLMLLNLIERIHWVVRVLCYYFHIWGPALTENIAFKALIFGNLHGLGESSIGCLNLLVLLPKIILCQRGFSMYLVRTLMRLPKLIQAVVWHYIYSGILRSCLIVFNLSGLRFRIHLTFLSSTALKEKFLKVSEWGTHPVAHTWRMIRARWFLVERDCWAGHLNRLRTVH